MPLEEYLAIPFMASRPLFRQIHAAIRGYADGEYRCRLCLCLGRCCRCLPGVAAAAASLPLLVLHHGWKLLLLLDGATRPASAGGRDASLAPGRALAWHQQSRATCLTCVRRRVLPTAAACAGASWRLDSALARTCCCLGRPQTAWGRIHTRRKMRGLGWAQRQRQKQPQPLLHRRRAEQGIASCSESRA
jgi:hypothetical protein